MSDYRDLWEEVGTLLRTLLSDATLTLSESERDSIEEVLSHNELGLAFDDLLFALTQSGQRLSDSQFQAIDAAGKNMKLDPRMWEALQPTAQDG